MITAVSWVPRGHASQFPTRYVFDEEEYDRISKLAKLELDDAKEDLAHAKAEESAQQNGASTDGQNGTKNAKEDDGDSDMFVLFYRMRLVIPY